MLLIYGSFNDTFNSPNYSIKWLVNNQMWKDAEGISLGPIWDNIRALYLRDKGKQQTCCCSPKTNGCWGEIWIHDLNHDFCVIWTNKMHFFLLICFNNHPLHVSNRLTILHQKEVYCGTLIVLAASQCRCMINTIHCIYNKLPLMMNSYLFGYVEDDYWNKLLEKSASWWSLLCKNITMHIPQNVKLHYDICYLRVLYAGIHHD
jgi:hypothetical protein